MTSMTKSSRYTAAKSPSAAGIAQSTHMGAHLSKLAAILLVLLAPNPCLWAQAGAVTLQNPRLTWLDNSGNPVTSGSLYTYVCGTTTDKDAYSDATLLTALPHPITLNSAGRAQTGGSVETAVYLAQACYKLVLKDSGGSTIWTQDNYYPATPVPTGAASVAKFYRGDYAWAQIENTVTTTSTGTQNDFAPGLVSGAVNLIRCNNASDLTVTGLSASSIADGTIAIFESIHATGNVFFKHGSTGSAAANRFTNMVTSGDTPIARGFATYVYDATSTVWRLIVHDQGSWITPPYSGGTYTATGGGTWTVDSGDVTTYRYRVNGRTLSLSVEADTTSIAGTVNSVNVFLPGGYTAITINRTVGLLYDNSLTLAVAAPVASAAATSFVTVSFLNSATNFAASANQTAVRFLITFEVT